MINRTILQGDVLDCLGNVPDSSINCIISSPPYWGLRDYGVSGQLGLEDDFKDYLETMKKIMTELKRVLRNDGTCWINLGDTYAGGSNHSNWGSVDDKFESQAMRDGEFKGKYRNHLQAKSRYGIPERFYINCIDDGWIARNHIPWYKASSMPSSVKDRFANKWESIFFLTKSPQYYFDLDAVREKTIGETKPFNVRVRDTDKPKFLQQATLSEVESHNKKGERKMANIENTRTQGIHRRREAGLSDLKQDSTLGPDGKPIPTYSGFNDRWSEKPNQKGKNPGDVFFINPRPFPEAHFATFPIDLPLKILKCGCPKDGTVLDPFFGSGTVGLAAEMLGVKWMGIELKEEYIQLARRRLAKYNNKSMGDYL